MSAGMGSRVRTDRVGPEKVMQVFGVQEWLRRAEESDRESPSGSRTAVVRVWVFVRTLGVWKSRISTCSAIIKSLLKM